MIQTKYFYLFCLLFISKVECINEIITLETTDSISCITENMNSSIYVSPPVVGEYNLQNTLRNSKWIDDDWTTKNAYSSQQEPVTDKRWEEFEVQDTNYTSFNNISSISFSIYSPLEMGIYLDDDNNMFYNKINWTSDEIQGKWTHLTIQLSNQNVNIFENERLRLTVENFIPHRIVMKTINKTYWKIHDYNFKWANTVQEESPTTLIIPPTGRSCVMIYVSLCNACLLKVGVVSGVAMSTKEIRSTNKPDNLMIAWQSHKIDIEPEVESIITFNRIKSSEKGDKFGYWGIDIRQCPSVEKNNKVIYKVNLTTLSNQAHKCTLLSEQDEQKTTTTNVEQNKPTECPPGMLGTKCDIKCEDLLGSQSPFCEKSRICEKLACFCAWGFHGDLCQENCAPGQWGLSCENVCNEKCRRSCDIMTGECAKKENLIYSTENTPSSESVKTTYMIILAVSGSIVLVLLVVGIICYVRYYQRRNVDKLGQGSENTQEEELLSLDFNSTADSKDKHLHV